MLAQPRPAPLQGSLVEHKATPTSNSAQPPLSYTTSTSTTTTTVVTTTTTTTTTTKTKSQAPTAETKTDPTVFESKALPKVPIEGKIGTRISSAPVLPPSPPSSIHGSDFEQGAVQRECQDVGPGGVRFDEEDNADRGNGAEEVFLPPPPLITRRNTTGSIKNSSPKQSPKKTYHQSSKPPLSAAPHPAFPLPYQGGFGEGSLDIASDIYKHSEKIRRERNLKRSKQLLQQQREQLGAEKRVEVGIAAANVASALETEPGPSVAHSTVPGISLGSAITTGNAIATAVGIVDALDEKPLVGNLIGEGHVNYVLMYNMLTGIRIAVSRCGGKIMRPIGQEDFKAEHKYSFDMWVIFLFYMP